MKTIYKLKSSTNKIFYVKEKVIKQSETIYNMIEEGVATGEIPLQVSSYTLVTVLKWCKQHQHCKTETDDNDNRDSKASKKEENDIKDWENKFSDELKADTDRLYDLITATDYLNVPALLDHICHVAADMMKGKSPEEIRQTFNIKNDFTCYEVKQIMDEHSWAFKR